jgi:hypothetical protein
MDKTALVGLEIADGELVVSALETRNIEIKVALWMITPEYEEGRLVIASDELPQEEPLKDYEKVAVILHESFAHQLPPILIMRMSDPFIAALRKLFAETRSVHGMRLGGQRIGNRYVEDAYVYKIR